jgi:hypothetical protein
MTFFFSFLFAIHLSDDDVSIEILTVDIACMSIYNRRQEKNVCMNMYLNTLIKRETSTSYFDFSLLFVYVHYRSNVIIFSKTRQA